MKGIRKLITEDLPKIGSINDWKNSVGYDVPFIYDDVTGTVKILKYDDATLTIKYSNNEPYQISTANFICCKIGNYVNAVDRRKDYKFEIGERIQNGNINITITNRYKTIDTRTNYGIKKYNYKCNVCGYNGEMLETLVGKTNCSCCTGRIVVLGINSIFDTDKWMVDLGISEYDAKRYTKSSGKKVKVKCPVCGEEKYKCIANIYTYKSITCNCGDGVSYPEKLMFSVLKQTGMDFKYQYSPKWIKPKRYDFYIPLINCIIEVNGEQHYQNSYHTIKGGKTLEEEQENDRIKETIALKNNIKNYIIIDCRISDLLFIKNNILNSNLFNLIDLSMINWAECEKFALSNRIKEACDLWNTNSFYSTKELGDYMNLSSSTISKYLKKGSQINLTNYNPKVESEKIINDNANKCSKSVEVYKNRKRLGTYKSCAEVQGKSVQDFGVFLYSSEIGRVCNKRKSSYKGFTFKYINDNDNMIVSESNNNGKRIEILKDGISLGIYDSCNLLSRISENEFGVKLLASKMSQVCNGIRKTHRGYTFRYLNKIIN